MNVPALERPDLLSQVEGVEVGLRRRRHLGRFGAVAFLVAAIVELVIGLLPALDVIQIEGVPKWLVIAVAVLAATSVILFAAGRYWLHESRRPFRYTCSLAGFAGLPPSREDALPWLHHDLRELLADRIQRLSFLEREPETADDLDLAHIHVGGEYVIRDEHGAWAFEVAPRVRIGGSAKAQALAHTVKYRASKQRARFRSQPPILTEGDDYEKLLERVYFSIATQLYRQIRKDVERKIELLPTRRLRATAYLHEADDYARSNTLDAYDAAQALYERALRLHGAYPERLPKPWLRRALRRSRGVAGLIRRGAGRWLSHAWRRFARREIMIARAELGYATVLLYRRVLSGFSGQRPNPIFEARWFAEQALTRLEALPGASDPVPGRDFGLARTLFDAHVACALVWVHLECPRRARERLDQAQDLAPQRTDTDARYLFARARLEARPRSALALLRRAAELDPRYEAAQFELARQGEMLWRQRRSLERTVGEIVLDQYRVVLKLDPANVQAWANVGYVHWLLARSAGPQGQAPPGASESQPPPDPTRLEAAADAYRRGRDFKQIRPETFVAELDYGLARIAAERGDWDAAYRHYIDAVTASVAQGVSPAGSAQQSHFGLIGAAMMGRFERYKGYVIELLAKDDDAEAAGRAARSTERLRRSVRAFVLNDYAEASFSAYQRSGEPSRLSAAADAYTQACRENPSYAIPHFNLCALHLTEGEIEAARRELEQVEKLEPNWPDAILLGWQLRAHYVVQATHRRHEIQIELSAMDGEGEVVDPPEPIAAGVEAVDGEPEHRSALTAAPAGAGNPDKELAAAVGADGTRRVSASAPGDALLRDRDSVRRRKLEEEKSELERRITTAADAVSDLGRLVPHPWLLEARAAGEADRRTLDWKALDLDDLRWERELDDLHARALYTWAICRAIGLAQEPMAAPEKGIRRLYRGHQEVRPADLRRLFEHLAGHFWPDLWIFLDAWRTLPEIGSEKREEIELRIRAILAWATDGDPEDWHVLRLLVGESFEAEEKLERLLAALDGGHAQASLAGWLGEQLESLGEESEVSGVWDQSRRAGVWDQSLRAYRLALDGLAPAGPRPEWRLGAGRAQWMTGGPADAVRRFGEVDNDEHRPDPGWRLETVRRLLVGSARGRGGGELQRWLERSHHDRVADRREEEAGDAARALLRLVATVDGHTDPSGTLTLDPQELFDETPIPVPLTLDAHPSFFPEDGDTQLVEQLGDELERMRERVWEEMGVPVPASRLRRNEACEQDEFWVLVDEETVATRSVGSNADAAAEMVSCIEGVVRASLRRFLGLGDLRRLLADAGLEPELADDAARSRLLRVLRARLDRGRSVADLRRIVAELERSDRAAPGQTIAELEEEVAIRMDGGGRRSKVVAQALWASRIDADSATHAAAGGR